MDRIIKEHITTAYPSIYDWLHKHAYPKHIVTQLKQDTTCVLLNGSPALLREELIPGDELCLLIKELSTSNIIPMPLELVILYEDKDLIVIEKPAHLAVHPSIKHHEDTLANGLMDYYKNENFVFRCINRLDRDTSGLILIAKNPLSGAFLQRQMKAREIHRTYLAIVEGELPPSGTIDAPIARTADSVVTRCIDYEKGERAITHYQTLDYKNNYSLAEITLETGRTHQIRVHMASIDHPLPGDFLYNPNNTEISRQALHSYKLDFIHPITREPLRFISDLPEDMARLLI